MDMDIFYNVIEIKDGKRKIVPGGPMPYPRAISLKDRCDMQAPKGVSYVVEEVK